MVGIFRVVKPAHRDLETDEYRIAVADDDNKRVKDGMVYVRLDWLLGLRDDSKMHCPTCVTVRETILETGGTPDA